MIFFMSLQVGKNIANLYRLYLGWDHSFHCGEMIHELGAGRSTISWNDQGLLRWPLREEACNSGVFPWEPQRSWITQTSWDLGFQLPKLHFCHILFAKAIYMSKLKCHKWQGSYVDIEVIMWPHFLAAMTFYLALRLRQQSQLTMDYNAISQTESFSPVSGFLRCHSDRKLTNMNISTSNFPQNLRQVFIKGEEKGQRTEDKSHSLP